MANYRKFVYVNADGDYQEHDVANDQLQLHSIKLGALSASPAVNGISLLGDIDLNESSRVINALDPISAHELVNKRYVDAIAAGLHPKSDVRVATTDAANLVGYTYVNGSDNNTTATPLVWTGVAVAPTIDGVELNDGDRLLIKDAADAKANGIFTYDATDEGFRRATDADNVNILANSEVKGGLFVFVTSGTANSAKGFIMTTPETIVTLGTSELVFTTFTSPGPILVDDIWLTRTGNVIYFDRLADQNVIIGGTDNKPAKYDTTDGAIATVGGYTGGSNQIEASTAAGLVIKESSIKDDQVAADAAIQVSKLDVDTAFNYGDATDSPVAITGDDSGLVALQKLQQNLAALAETATTGDEVGAHLVALPDDIVGFSATTDDVADALNELAGEDMVVTNAKNVVIGDVLFITAAGTVEAYDDIAVIKRPVGIAATTVAGDGTKTVKVVTGVARGLSGLTAGVRYFWNPEQGAGAAGWEATQADFLSGDYIFQVGIGKSATEAFVAIDFVKRNA